MNSVENKKVVIWGASSGVGRALAYYLASLNYDLFLCARGERDLCAIAKDIENKYHVNLSYLTIDVNNSSDVDGFYNKVDINKYNEIYITIGKVNDNDNGELADNVFDDLVQTNFIAPVKIINGILSHHNNANSIRILVVTSIAISRARKNNIAYASAKKALDF